MPSGATVTIRSVVIFRAPGCSPNLSNNSGHARSGVNILTSQINDTDLNNNFESDYLTLPPGQPCSNADLRITKTQINPTLPEGSSSENTTNWGAITYEITVINDGTVDTEIQMFDYIPQDFNLLVTESHEYRRIDGWRC